MKKKFDEKLITAWQQSLKAMNPETIISWAIRVFGSRVAFASSMGLEDQVLTDMIGKTTKRLEIFTLDTGRLFPETYDLIDQTEQRYGFKIKIYSPDASEVEWLVNEYGVNLFRKSVELRKSCCLVRKIHPLERALSGLDAWITGLRRDQSVTRHEQQIVEWDKTNGLVKINPLINWSEKEVWTYIKKYKVPYNKLHDQGFPSIGCACCTRAIQEGEDIRDGRWWWESPEHKECGLHFKEGKVVRKKAK